MAASSRSFARALLLGAALATSFGAAHAVLGGKKYATVDGWEVRKFNGYCAASISFEGDRALRLHAGKDGSSIGFMGPETGADKPGTKVKVTYWFGNDKKNKFTRTAVRRANQAEDGGAPWLLLQDPPNEPSHAGALAVDKSVTFTYKAGGAAQSETYSLKGADNAMQKVFACAGV